MLRDYGINPVAICRARFSTYFGQGTFWPKSVRTLKLCREQNKQRGEQQDRRHRKPKLTRERAEEVEETVRNEAPSPSHGKGRVDLKVRLKNVGTLRVRTLWTTVEKSKYRLRSGVPL